MAYVFLQVFGPLCMDDHDRSALLNTALRCIHGSLHDGPLIPVRPCYNLLHAVSHLLLLWHGLQNFSAEISVHENLKDRVQVTS